MWMELHRASGTGSWFRLAHDSRMHDSASMEFLWDGQTDTTDIYGARIIRQPAGNNTVHTALFFILVLFAFTILMIGYIHHYCILIGSRMSKLIGGWRSVTSLIMMNNMGTCNNEKTTRVACLITVLYYATYDKHTLHFFSVRLDLLFALLFLVLLALRSCLVSVGNHVVVHLLPLLLPGNVY